MRSDSSIATVIATTLREREVAERLVAKGTEVIPTTPEAFAAHMKIEIAKWAQVVRHAGIKAE